MVASILLFPGQGAQRVGMGRDLADRFPEARRVFDAVDEALQTPLSRLMWEGPEDELTLTHNAQPAIVAHSLAVHAVLRDALQPAAVLGHSVGEFSAYAAAGALDLADTVRLVRRRGELMQEAGTQRAGAMSAIVGMAGENVERVCRTVGDADRVVVAANLNAPEQTVISGDPAAVEEAGAACREAGARRVLPLKVSGAFHSPLMEPAVEPFREALAAVRWRDPKVPVVSSARATVVRTGAEARSILDRQLVEPVQWVRAVRAAWTLAAGPDTDFLELGPGRVLAGLLKRIVPKARVTSIGDPAAVESLLEMAS